MKKVGIKIGTLLMIYGISLNIINKNLFTVSLIPEILGILLFLYHFVKRKIHKMVKKIIYITLCIGVLIMFAIEGVIIGSPKISEENTDYIIVMPTNAEEVGEKLTLTLRGRLDLVVKNIYEDANDGLIVVTGGEIENSNLNEADLMESYLLDRGVSKDKIIKVYSSRNPKEALLNVKKVIRDNCKKEVNDNTVKIVTTDYAAVSTKILAKKLGFTNFEMNTSDTVIYLVPALYAYEPYFVIKNFFL